ncbi:MAG: hypothetical protein ACOZQL_00760 [Myxococcota bacterium]
MRRLIAALVCLGSSWGLADLTLVNEATSNGKTRQVTLSTKGNRAFFEIKEADGTTRNMLRDAEAKKLFLIDHAKQTVVVVTEADSKALEQKQAELRAQVAAQLARMPPEQRARMEQTMLGPATPDAKPVQYTYERKKTPARKVGAFSCQDYVIKRDGAVQGEACFMPWKDAGFTAEEFKELMVRALPTSATSQPMAMSFDAHANAPGVPVWRKMVDAAGNPTSEMTLKTLSKTAVAAERFELPKGYTEKSMAESMNQPRPPAK